LLIFCWHDQSNPAVKELDYMESVENGDGSTFKHGVIRSAEVEMTGSVHTQSCLVFGLLELILTDCLW